MIQVIDNFLPPSYHQEVCQFLSSDQFPWYYANGVAQPNDGDFFFTHNVFNQENGICTSFWTKFSPFLILIEEKLKFKIDELLRIKCNLYSNQNISLAHNQHVDFKYPHYTALYYVNTNNGCTTIGDTNIDAIENRLVFFDGTIFHNSNLQTDTNVRINININLKGNFYE